MFVHKEICVGKVQDTEQAFTSIIQVPPNDDGGISWLPFQGHSPDLTVNGEHI